MPKLGWSTLNEDYLGLERTQKSWRKVSIQHIPLGLSVRGSIRKGALDTSNAVTFRVRRGNGYGGSVSGHVYQDKMKYYTPTNPQTEAQQVRRLKFADGVQAWHDLAESEKKFYNLLASRSKFATGFTFFMSEYMNT